MMAATSSAGYWFFHQNSVSVDSGKDTSSGSALTEKLITDVAVATKDTSSTQVRVISQLAGQAPEDMERTVTRCQSSARSVAYPI